MSWKITFVCRLRTGHDELHKECLLLSNTWFTTETVNKFYGTYITNKLWSYLMDWYVISAIKFCRTWLSVLGLESFDIKFWRLMEIHHVSKGLDFKVILQLKARTKFCKVACKTHHGCQFVLGKYAFIGPCIVTRVSWLLLSIQILEG